MSNERVERSRFNQARLRVLSSLLLAAGMTTAPGRLLGGESKSASPNAEAPEVSIQLPGSPSIPGRTLPEGLLCILGDSRLRLSGHPARLVQSPDGLRGFALSNTNVVDVVDLASLQMTESFEASESRVLEVAVSPDGTRIATASLDGVLTVWDVSMTPARRLHRDEALVEPEKNDVWLNLSASRNRSRFCISSQSRVIVFEWKPEGLRRIFDRRETLAFHPAFLAPGGDRLILQSQMPSELQLWDLAATPPRVVDRLAVDKSMPSIVAAQTDKILLTTSSSFPTPNTRLISIEHDRLALRGGELPFTDGFRPPVLFDGGKKCVGFDPKKGLAIFDCTGDQWSVIQSLQSATSRQLCVLGASADGTALYATRDQWLTTLRRKAGGIEFVETAPKTGPVLGKVDYSAFLSDSTLVISTEAGSVHAISLDEPTRPRSLAPIRLTAPLVGSSYLVPHPTAREFVIINIAAPGHVIQVCDDGGGFAEIQRFTFGKGVDDYQAAPWSAGYSPDGRILAVGFWNRSINLYENGPLGLVLHSSRPNMADGHVCVLTFAPDGRSIACGDFSHNARILSFSDGGIGASQHFPKFGDAVRNAAYNIDGGLLALGSQNGEIRLTDLTVDPPTSRQLLLPGEKEASPGINSDGGVTSLQWVGGGKLLMTAKSRRGGTQVGLWKMPDATPLQQWTFTGWMRAAISPDGFVVAVARADGTVCVMQVSDEVQKWLSDVP